MGLGDEALEETIIFDDIEEIFRKIEIDTQGGKLLNAKQLKLLKHQLWEKYGVRLKLVDKDHTLAQKLARWKEKGTVGSFSPKPPPTMYLLEGNASELTVYHEMVHLEVWYKKLPKMHIIDEEKYVWEEIWKVRHRWTDDELIASYNYVNKEVYEFNKQGKKFPYLQNPEMEQIIINKQMGIR